MNTMNNHAYNTVRLLALSHKPIWAFFSSGGTLIRVTKSEHAAAECLSRYKSNGGKVKAEVVEDVTVYILH